MTKPLKLRRSQAQEKRSAERFGGTRQPMSGAGSAKNDVRTERYLIENKRTDNTRQITIKLSDIDGLAKNAALASREPLMNIEISGRHFILCEEWVWDNKGCEDA